MTCSNSKLTCAVCQRPGRHIIFHKGHFLCRLCIRKLPNTKIQTRVIMFYDFINKRGLYKRYATRKKT